MVHPHDICSDAEPWTVRIVYIAKEFIKNGHNVKLVYFPLDRQKKMPQELSEGVTAVPFPRMHGPRIFISNIVKLYNFAGWADIIHFQKCFYHAALPAIIAAFLRNKPIHYDWDDWEAKIYEVSTHPGILRSFIWNFLNILEKMIPKIVDTVSVASVRLEIECKKLGVDKERIFEAHVGADITRFHPGIDGENIRQRYKIEKPLILYLGQLHGGQYVELFIEAASRIINEYKKDASFMIVGDGYQAGELKKFSQRLNLNGKLIFSGAVAHELVPQYIAAADICVACFEENEVTICKSPLKIVEYLASGKAIVASNVGEVPNMLGNAGILTLPGDVHSLSIGIIKLLENDNLRKNLGRLARERVEEKYNWTVTAENFLSAYEKAILIHSVR